MLCTPGDVVITNVQMDGVITSSMGCKYPLLVTIGIWGYIVYAAIVLMSVM